MLRAENFRIVANAWFPLLVTLKIKIIKIILFLRKFSKIQPIRVGDAKSWTVNIIARHLMTEFSLVGIN